MQFVSNLIRFGDKHQLITAEVFGPLLFSFINIMTTWTKNQLIETSLSLVRMKSQLAVIEHKWETYSKDRSTYHKKVMFEKKQRSLRRKIESMEKEFLLNVAGNGIEEDANAEPPSKNKEQQTLKVDF